MAELPVPRTPYGRVADALLDFSLQTRIRVRFGNRSMLEGVFPSTDKLGAIYEFVKASLAEEVKQERFVLCLYFSLSSNC